MFEGCNQLLSHNWRRVHVNKAAFSTGSGVAANANDSRRVPYLYIELCETAETRMNIGFAADEEPTDLRKAVGLEATRRGAD